MSLAERRQYAIFASDAKPDDLPLAIYSAYTPAGALNYHAAQTLTVRRLTTPEAMDAGAAGMKIITVPDAKE